MGVTDPDCGEVPAALVTIREGMTYDPEAVSQVLNKLEMPRDLRVVEELPLNAAGKIDKPKIKGMFS